MADILVLIPGASEGKGLGIQFLKPVERTAIIAHLLELTHLQEDGEEADLETVFDAINFELAAFSEELGERQQIVVLSKADAASSDEKVARYVEVFEKRDYRVFVVSSVTGRGIPELVAYLADMVDAGRKVRADQLAQAADSVNSYNDV